METAHEQPATTVTELGAPIGLGRTAEVYAWGDNGVLKLLRPGFPDLLGELEANVAALVSRASVGAPRFIGTVRLEGRFGLIYERLAGPSMLDGLSARPWQIDRLPGDSPNSTPSCTRRPAPGRQTRKRICGE